MTTNLLYKREIVVNDYITIVVPKVSEILDGDKEDEYYTLVSLITAMPIDLMVQLDDIGIDFTDIDEYELFLLTFKSLQNQDTSMIFKDLDLSDFKAIKKTEINSVVLRNSSGCEIDRFVYENIADVLRKIHRLEKNMKKPANKEAKEYLIERARKKQKRNRNKKTDSQLETLIVAMVNTEQYKYDFEGTRDLSIYQFNESVKQVIKKIDYDNRMYGVYAGTVSVKDLSEYDLNWIIHK